ncbi:sulfite exporter TauE/SafE family protein [Ponticoccus sp. SC2-23]|uniref:sulfite exporter TauE/SafE family protein n=1 Tax=Alexandriicola marinus TaxID=2081710 RepID=UPI000FD980C0|nr:sulfite exporter TauE/SafE family protein [Alexandriicola marinus]MBM1220541.1 sulfite exporter TauE/SafE family protein [Ponticoccus sp. SC6-9]MBM1225227.1 sulfite exporter TauE/SafE family protein [Ponticoccus sp. SC6-15]MBM1228741.1 sulfite exporter TauE/SafE family protein [Ponticoccus sp. SC6-38]MBM1233622.1 sulfite exporter TauE/SafE family protein [Ponticoccus sp. SC6-45]MBM1239242.1 sulfite exporter TauE/SafE family protein [Ponticoccus sp. SC6-49]MBM1243024.1 sulfite exporter TauE
MVVATLAVTLVGLAKGGLGGATALFGMVILSTVLSPVQAAGILLPILVIMDLVGVVIWRGQWDLGILKIMLPGALIGIGIGWLTAAMVSDDAIRLIVGSIALLFALRWAWSLRGPKAAPRPHHAGRATFWGAVSGYTSFVAHAGGPPYQIYTLPLGMKPTTYTATSVLFFTIVNAVKLGPYFFLGQFATENLLTSAVLIPIAVLAVMLGAAVVKRLKPAVFYPVMYVFIFFVSLKLIWDGLGAF